MNRVKIADPAVCHWPHYHILIHTIMPPLDKKIKKFLKNSIRVAPKISSKGELGELRNGLVSAYPQTRKDAIKKTIQQMTLGKDMSTLFPDVLKNIATNDVEQKKLVYLYVMNYAELHPELCILAVNTFITDAQEPNPLIRCMAIRTMSMIRVDKILEYIDTPLRKTLQDDNPYVRKTAVICVAKLFQLNEKLCIELGVLEDLINALDDNNPMVIANSIASLMEINAMNNTAINLKELIAKHVTKFLMVLNECTEWARITILTALSEYNAKDSLEARDIIDRVTAHLQHVNSAVVLATIKVILRNLEELDASETMTNSLIMKKISSAIVSLMSTPPEIQYVALKNIRIILEKYPELLTKELRIFYVKFNDPMYIKLEKIEILIRLVDPTNLKQCTLLLNELKEYSMEYEPEFVSRAILGLSQLGIKYSNETFIQKIVDIICNEILERGLENVFDDCCITLCNLLRHVPKNVEISKQVCSILNSWSSPETILTTDKAKSSYIWLMSCYPQYFPNLMEKIMSFMEIFSQEESMTQITLLTTVVKLHDKLNGNVLQKMFEIATTETTEVDIRDLAMIYWRCFSLDDETNNENLINQLCNMPILQVDNIMEKFSPELLNDLIMQLGEISSLYYKSNKEFKTLRINRSNNIQSHNLNVLQDLATHELSRAQDDVLLDLDGDYDTTPSGGNENSSNSNNGTHLYDELNDIFQSSTVTSGVEQLNLGSNSNNSNDSNNNKKNNNTTNMQELLDLF